MYHFAVSNSGSFIGKTPVLLAEFFAKRIRTVFTDFPCLLMIFPKLLISLLFCLPAAEPERSPVQEIPSAAREAVLRSFLALAAL